jgi:hypothetical protein
VYQQAPYRQPSWPGPERIAPHLVLRLMRRADLPAGYDVVSTVLSDELFGLLCVQEQGRDGVRPVGNADAQRWGSDPRTLWGWGLDNLRRDEISVRPTDTTTGNRLHVVMGRSGTASAQLLRVAELLHEPAPFGLFVAVPVHGVLIFMVLRSHADLRMVPFVINTGRSLGRSSPMLSERLYWWHNGSLEHIGVTMRSPDDAQLSVQLGFHQMLQHLPR